MEDTDNVVRSRSGSKASMKSVTSSQSDKGSAVGLKRTLGLGGGISYIIGVMIGSGIFISPVGVLDGAGSVGLSLVLWIAGGILSLFGALSYAELGTAIPKSGGEYAYLLDSLHPVFAFLFAWVSAWILKPSGVAVIALTCAEYVLVPLFNDDCGKPPVFETKMLAITVILVLAAINVMSVEYANKVQIFCTLAKLLALGIIILGGIIRLCMGEVQYLKNMFEGTNNNIGEIAIGFYSSMWAYDGWNNLNYVTEELKNPSKNLPRAIEIGIPLVTLLYFLTNISYFTAMSAETLLDSPAVAVTWAEIVIENISWIMPVFVAMSTFGAANGILFSTARLLFVAGREKHMVKSLSMINVHTFSPAPAIVFTVLISVLMVIPSNIYGLINFFSFAAWMFYGLVFACHVYLRFKKPELPRPYKCPIVLSIIACLVAIFIVLAPVIYAPQLEFLYAFLFIIGGVIFYFPFVHFKYEIPGMAKFNTGLQLLFEVTPPDESYLAELLGENVDEQMKDTQGRAKIEGDDTNSRAQSRASNKVLPVVDEHELAPVSSS